MTATLIGYARCSTDRRDLTAQRQALKDLGVASDRIYVDKGLTGTNRACPGLDQAMAAGRSGIVSPESSSSFPLIPFIFHNLDELAPTFGGNFHP